MQVQEVWSGRWQNCAHPLSHQYMLSAFKKKSAVVLAADFFKTKDLSDMINSVGEYITAVKTHVDMIEDFNQESWAEVINTALAFTPPHASTTTFIGTPVQKTQAAAPVFH